MSSSSAHFLIGLFVFWILSRMILETSPFSVASFTNIFSHSVGCLFVLSVVSFAVQKLLSLIRSHLFIFVFISITLGDRSKKILLQFMSKSVLPMFSSKSFIVSSLTFRSSIHFEFIFVYGVKECSSFIFGNPPGDKSQMAKTSYTGVYVTGMQNIPEKLKQTLKPS